jgi:site-specific recombinase XerD
MDIVYLFFENENVRIPFYNFDKKLFNQLVKSGTGHWEKCDKQYNISWSGYDPNQLKEILSGKPFVEVGKEPDNPIIVHSFISGGQTVPEKTKTAAALPETKTIPDTQTQVKNIPDQFSDYWREKLETEMRSRKYSHHTRTAYVNYNKAICKWLQKQPEEVTGDDVKRYLAFLEETKQQAAATLNYNLSAFKFFYRHVMKRDTAHEQKRPRQDKRLPVVLSKAEIKKMIDGERNTKHRLLLMIVYASGLRVSEAVRLKRQDIDISRKSLMIISGKGRKDRYTIMSQTVIETLALYYSQYEISGWLFRGADPSRHLNIRSAQHIFKHALKKAGIEKNASIHSLRHSFATHLLESGTDISYIGELMGHSSIRTTARYTQVARRKTLKITSPLDTIDREED